MSILVPELSPHSPSVAVLRSGHLLVLLHQMPRGSILLAYRRLQWTATVLSILECMEVLCVSTMSEGYENMVVIQEMPCLPGYFLTQDDRWMKRDLKPMPPSIPIEL